MKSPAFQFYAGDFLSSPDVRLMSLAERGAYITLLSSAWQSTPTGHLPADEKLVRRMAEMSPQDWEESADILLKKFPLSECGTYRYNPRLLAEVAKQQVFKQARSKAGQASAAKRAAQQNANKKPTYVEDKPTYVEEQGNINPSLRLQSSSSISPSVKEKNREREGAGEGGQSASGRSSAPSADEELPAEDPAAWASRTGAAAADELPTSGQPAPAPYRAYDPEDFSPALVLPFATDAFRAAWVKWRRYHASEVKRPLGGGMREQEALRKLSGLAGKSEPLAVAIIDQAISKGWKDVFPLDHSSPAYAKFTTAPNDSAHANATTFPTRSNAGPSNGSKPTSAGSQLARALAEQRAG